MSANQANRVAALVSFGLAVFAPWAAAQEVDYTRQIEPILSTHCQGCHGSTVQMNGLRLDSRSAALAGSHNGTIIKPGDAAGSLLIRMVTGAIEGKIMPPGGIRLTGEEIAILRAWIDQGAKGPLDQAPAKAKSTHWAFSPPMKPVPPKVQNESWVLNPIDAFVLAKLEREGIKPSPEANTAILLRRLSLDLTGLPPVPSEVEQFLADKRPDAYGRVVDRLFASPHYGEKWAIQWLDLARYADSDGYNQDKVRPYAWRWRDWVIRALNDNMPFDRFTVEQLAGDLLPGASAAQKIATGFHRNTLTMRESGSDSAEYRMENVIDRAATTGSVWLGLTVGCARCHNHKYDPITQKEFYQLTAFFNSARETEMVAPLPGEMTAYLQNRAEYQKKRSDLLAAHPDLPKLQQEWERKTLAAASDPKADNLWILQWRRFGWLFDGGQEILARDPAERTQREKDALTDFFLSEYSTVVSDEAYKGLKFAELRKAIGTLRSEYPELSMACVMAEEPQPVKTHILIRGDFHQPGIEVEPGTPAVLPPLSTVPNQRPANRLALAEWLVSRANPLTARVAVNRMWQELFGRGLVVTSDDFGLRGERPSHPELLDWLAVEFMDSGWDVKHMQKLMVTSRAYRQSSKGRPDLVAIDPNNRLLARQARIPLKAELVRDVMLSASGLLNPAVGGRSVRPPIPPGVIDLGYANTITWKESVGEDRYRRGVYTQFQRAVPYPQLLTFDAPNRLVTCSRRTRSITPLQSLALMNSPVALDAARALAVRVLLESSTISDERLDLLFRLCGSRAPTAAERRDMEDFMGKQRHMLEHDPELVRALCPAAEVEGIRAVEIAVWVAASRVVLNLDETITRE